MKKINNKGFTLIEVLAVIALIALIGGIAIPNVLNTINTSKNKSEEMMIENIKTASQQLYEEVEFSSKALYQYDDDGIKTNNEIKIASNKIKINLQTLVSNGFLSGTGKNNETRKLLNPGTGENIGSCKITITKVVDSDYNVTYTISNNSTNNCPNY